MPVEPLDEPVPPEAAPVLGVSLFVSLEPLAEPLADGVCALPLAEPLFCSVDEDEPEAAEPLSDFFELDAPLEAEPSMPSADSVCWSSWPLAFRPFDCWKSLSAFCVCGPILPSAVTFSFSWTFLMSSASCWPPLEPAAAVPDFCDLADEPAAAEPDFCSDLPDAPVAAEPDFCSVLDDAPLLAGELLLAPPDTLPLADGVEDEEAPLAGELELALPVVLLSVDFCSVVALPLADVLPLDDISFCFALSVDALPPAAALPLAEESVEGFCSWLIEGDELEGDCCCLSCATAESDNIAAATATAIGLNLI